MRSYGHRPKWQNVLEVNLVGIYPYTVVSVQHYIKGAESLPRITEKYVETRKSVILSRGAD